ncbi:hypothetical protein CBR_g18867 [Chara braunii]|uniref:Uncharacterized protein n=1 Tax=Chara braunii TaxID=69332 RepID=A0A388KWS1_CHABU|nr:hypothetical protein CBR_g18867 [Chara braunii]|eukprot:GBG74458.1 hypothetical protein CBR_g18867 [Chara braunii]
METARVEIAAVEATALEKAAVETTVVASAATETVEAVETAAAETAAAETVAVETTAVETAVAETAAVEIAAVETAVAADEQAGAGQERRGAKKKVDDAGTIAAFYPGGRGINVEYYAGPYSPPAGLPSGGNASNSTLIQAPRVITDLMEVTEEMLEYTYVKKLQAYFVPPTTGHYQFSMYSDYSGYRSTRPEEGEVQQDKVRRSPIRARRVEEEKIKGTPATQAERKGYKQCKLTATPPEDWQIQGTELRRKM